MVGETKQKETLNASKRAKEQKVKQDSRAQAAASGVKNPQIPAEISFIFNTLDGMFRIL